MGCWYKRISRPTFPLLRHRRPRQPGDLIGRTQRPQQQAHSTRHKVTGIQGQGQNRSRPYLVQSHLRSGPSRPSIGYLTPHSSVAPSPSILNHSPACNRRMRQAENPTTTHATTSTTKTILPATGAQSYRNIHNNGPTCYHFLSLTYDDQQIEPLPADAVSDAFPVVRALLVRPNSKCERVITAYLKKLARE